MSDGFNSVDLCERSSMDGENALHELREGAQNIDTSDGTAVVTVKDSGAGITNEEQQYLFKRFYQSSTGRKHNLGTGLGLYV